MSSTFTSHSATSFNRVEGIGRKEDNGKGMLALGYGVKTVSIKWVLLSIKVRSRIALHAYSLHIYLDHRSENLLAITVVLFLAQMAEGDWDRARKKRERRKKLWTITFLLLLQSSQPRAAMRRRPPNSWEAAGKLCDHHPAKVLVWHSDSKIYANARREFSAFHSYLLREDRVADGDPPLPCCRWLGCCSKNRSFFYFMGLFLHRFNLPNWPHWRCCYCRYYCCHCCCYYSEIKYEFITVSCLFKLLCFYLVVVDVVGSIDHSVDHGEDEGQVTEWRHLAGLFARLTARIGQEHDRLLLSIGDIIASLQILSWCYSYKMHTFQASIWYQTLKNIGQRCPPLCLVFPAAKFQRILRWRRSYLATRPLLRPWIKMKFAPKCEAHTRGLASSFRRESLNLSLIRARKGASFCHWNVVVKNLFLQFLKILENINDPVFLILRVRIGCNSTVTLHNGMTAMRRRGLFLRFRKYCAWGWEKIVLKGSGKILLFP